MAKVIHVIKADNYENTYMTREAYKALTLMMSSGDHGSHIAKPVSKAPKSADVLTLKDIDPMAHVSKVLATYPKHLKEYAEQNSFRARNSRGGLDSYSNYSGHDFDYFVCSVGRGRDSDTLSESNFAAALDMFGGESDTVQVSRISHWACGWVEGIMIDPTDRKALQTAYDISKALEHYPVLDDSDYSERERDSVNEDFEYYQGEFETDVLNALGLDRDELKAQLSKAELKRFESDLTQLTRICHESSVSYCGHEDAWVSVDSVIASIESNAYEVIGLEYIGEYALAVCGLEVNPEYVAGYHNGRNQWVPSVGKQTRQIGGSNE